jgi:molybdopterin-guanine dinucleotide biosynthesis protein A
MGGIVTALKTSRADAELLLACDMPFVSPALLRQLLRRSGSPRRAAFVAHEGLAGFPCLLPVSVLEAVEKQIRRQQWSLQSLAKTLRGIEVPVSSRRQHELLNINSLQDWQSARRLLLCKAGEIAKNRHKSRL